MTRARPGLRYALFCGSCVAAMGYMLTADLQVLGRIAVAASTGLATCLTCRWIYRS